MDEPEPGALYIHDWDQWQEQWYKAMERREKDAKRKAESRKGKPDVKSPSADAAKKGTTPLTDLRGIVGAPDGLGGQEPKGQPEPPKYDGYSDEELLEAAKAYAAQCKKAKTDKQYIKHPKTFLSDSLPFLEYIPKKDMPLVQQEPQGGNPFAEWREDT